MTKLFLGGVALAALVSATAVANAQSSGPPVVLANGLYLSVDGGWQQVKLPTYAIGIRSATIAGIVTDLGPVSAFSQRFDGYNIHGLIGYRIFTNARIELGGHYAHASGAQNSDALLNAVNGVSQISFLDGLSPSGTLFLCSPAVNCRVTAAQSTNHSNWQLNGRFATDFRSGPATLTPSVVVFGGQGRVNQTLDQAFAQLVAGGNTGTYSATTSLKWTDVGVKLGMNADLDVNAWLTVGLGGYVGAVHRSARLNGSDVGTDTVAGVAVFDGASTVSASAISRAWVANTEAHATFKVMQNIALRVFGGLNYDSGVPGVSTPGFVIGTTSTPAGIKFQSFTTYYAGGGAIWAF